MDYAGQLVTEYRTGIRDPHAVLHLSGGVLQVVNSGGTPHLFGYYNGRFHGATADVSRTATDTAAPIAIYPDPHDNLYTLIAPGVIRYTSAAGRRLYERPLPAAIRSHAVDGETLFIGLTDGRLFGFFRDGRGEVLTRLPAPIVDLRVPLDGRSRYLLALDESGTVYRLDPHASGGGNQRELRIRWSRDLSGEIRGGRLRFAASAAAAPTAIYAVGGGLGVLAADGELLWVRTVPGTGFQWAGAYEFPAFVTAVTTDGRLFVFDAAGELVAVRQLQRRPVALYPLPRRGQLFVEYPEWRYELLELRDRSAAAPPDENGETGASRLPVLFSGGTTISVSGYARSGALGALSGSVLDGTSREERRSLLKTLHNRLERESLFGAVETFRASLVELSQEAYRDPRGRGGVVQNDFPTVRRAAVELLANLGDRPSRRALAEVIRHDPDPNVVAAALRAIAAGGRDDVSAVVIGYERFQRFADRERAVVAAALVDCLEVVVPAREVHDVARFQEIAVELAAAAVPRSVRERALSVGRRW